MFYLSTVTTLKLLICCIIIACVVTVLILKIKDQDQSLRIGDKFRSYDPFDEKVYEIMAIKGKWVKYKFGTDPMCINSAEINVFCDGHRKIK